MYQFLKFTRDGADVSNLMFVGWLRYVQSLHEPRDQRNGDRLVGRIIPLKARWRARLLRRKTLESLRGDPFYYYLLARTAYYDAVVRQSLAEGMRQMIVIGCGTDTRAYRFAEALGKQKVAVLECDQPSVIGIKREQARRSWPHSTVSYLGLDLNDGTWPGLEMWLDRHAGAKTLVLMEGVSPYVNESAFCDFLRLLCGKVGAESVVAYDFKIGGANDDLGRSPQTGVPFRLPAVREAVAAFHERLGFRLQSMEVSSALCERLVPQRPGAHGPPFGEDCLVQLRPSAP